MLLNQIDHPWIEVTYSNPSIRAGDAQKHIPEELLPIRITPPFLLELIKHRLNFFFAEHQRPTP